MVHPTLLAAVALIAVTGCSSIRGNDATVVGATPYSATIRFNEGRLDKATSRAEELCATHRRSAQLRTVTPGKGSERIGNFDCV